jgi:hypothetical protein
MFDFDDRTWVDKSLIATHANVAIAFLLTTHYHPGANAPDIEHAIALPLSLPATARAGSCAVSSDDATDNEQGLVDHYEAVLQHARRYGHAYHECSHYFWLSLRISWSERVLSFPYHTSAEMSPMFDRLARADDGDAWSDIGQGWEMIAVRVGSHFHFREGDGDGNEHVNIALPRDELLESIAAKRDRMRVIIDRLVNKFGEDYWTHHRYDLRADLASPGRRLRGWIRDRL